jgi:hypothetical protein
MVIGSSGENDHDLGAAGDTGGRLAAMYQAIIKQAFTVMSLGVV